MTEEKNDEVQKSAGAEVELACFLERTRDVVLAHGDFSQLSDAFSTHIKRFGSDDSDVTLEMATAGLAATSLHLACRPPDEFSAWTLNLDNPPLNLFFAGDNNEFKVTGRVFTRDVKTVGINRLFHESQRPKKKPTQSMVDVKGRDVLSMYEQFYLKSDQLKTRLFALPKQRFVFIQGLPRVDRDWMDALDLDSVAELIARELELVEERNYRFLCGCDLLKIVGILTSMFKDRVDELFQGEEQVEIHCPRCGRNWWVSLDEYQSGPGKLGLA